MMGLLRGRVFLAAALGYGYGLGLPYPRAPTPAGQGRPASSVAASAPGRRRSQVESLFGGSVTAARITALARLGNLLAAPSKKVSRERRDA